MPCGKKCQTGKKCPASSRGKSRSVHRSLIDLTSLFGVFGSDPRLQAIFTTLTPYIPAIKREGEAFYQDVMSYAVEGKWTELDELAWKKMTEDERDALSAQILADARDAVDREFERKKFFRECVVRLAGSLLTMLL